MEKIELLAPAGSMESLIAAINKGADAIYLGGDKFSARAYASNFDRKTMEEAVDYAHSYGVKVYVTLNTLIKENEFNEAIDYVGFLYRIGVDALIIQDTGILNKAKRIYPELELHASTQMSIHNAEGALFFRENGFQRIVLSRELSLNEIEYISKDLGIETEMFVHGALCVSYSGQCLMSSMIGGRSGNRGRCAQSCRLPYTLIRESDRKETKGYLLSPKDMCTIDNIADLIKTGTSSLKVEGRMKKPEYVAGVIQSYRDAIDEVLGVKKKEDNNDRKKTLLKLFNREGFSNAYLYKNTGKDMMAYNNPKNTGVYIGKIGKNCETILEEDISLKDGIRAEDNGFILTKITLNAKEVESAKKGDKVVLYPKKYRIGDKCYKMSDTKLLATLKKAYEKRYGRKIELEANVRFKVGMPFEISVEYNGRKYVKSGDIVEKAVNSPLDITKVEKNIKKSGEVPYKIEKIIFEDFEDGFLSIGAINNLRREILEEILDYEVNRFKKTVKPLNNPDVQTDRNRNIEGIYARVSTADQLQALMDLGAENIIVDIFGKNKTTLNKSVFKTLEDFKGKVYLEIPNIVKEEFEVICKVIDSLKDKIAGLSTGNIGIIRRYKDEMEILGGYKINIFNSESLKFYNKNIDGVCLSLELNRKEIKSMLDKENKGTQFFIYGKPEVMVNEYCPIGSTFGGKTTNRTCDDQCIESNFRLKDRINEEFIIRTDIFCRAHIYNPVPVNITSEIKDIESLGIKSFRVDFVDESYNEVKNVMLAVMNKETLKIDKFTKGHYRRGVE